MQSFPVVLQEFFSKYRKFSSHFCSQPALKITEWKYQRRRTLEIEYVLTFERVEVLLYR
jgi:hypothetical protein